MTCPSPESVQDGDRAGLETEKNHIESALKELRNTGWYWGGLTASEAGEVLLDRAEGSFLLRDSSQSHFLFTISSMTSSGPTNLRIQYKHGQFKLDSLVPVKLEEFDSVVALVEHYMTSSLTGQSASQRSCGSVQLLLTRPVYATPPTLQHLCRVAINRKTNEVQQLPIPKRLRDYMMEYTYRI